MHVPFNANRLKSQPHAGGAKKPISYFIANLHDKVDA